MTFSRYFLLDYLYAFFIAVVVAVVVVVCIVCVELIKYAFIIYI